MSAAFPAVVDTALVLVILHIAGQLCGIPVGGVRDILSEQLITPIPLAPPEVAGSLNLRGRIVTAIDLRRRFCLPPRQSGCPYMAVVTEQEAELYALLVDQVVEVLGLSGCQIEANPPTLPSIWSRFSHGVCRLEHGLMIILDVDRVLAITSDRTS